MSKLKGVFSDWKHFKLERIERSSGDIVLQELNSIMHKKDNKERALEITQTIPQMLPLRDIVSAAQKQTKSLPVFISDIWKRINSVEESIDKDEMYCFTKFQCDQTYLQNVSNVGNWKANHRTIFSKHNFASTPVMLSGHPCTKNWEKKTGIVQSVIGSVQDQLNLFKKVNPHKWHEALNSKSLLKLKLARQ